MGEAGMQHADLLIRSSLGLWIFLEDTSACSRASQGFGWAACNSTQCNNTGSRCSSYFIYVLNSFNQCEKKNNFNGIQQMNSHCTHTDPGTDHNMYLQKHHVLHQGVLWLKFTLWYLYNADSQISIPFNLNLLMQAGWCSSDYLMVPRVSVSMRLRVCEFIPMW